MVSLDWQHDIASVLDENERLKRRTERQTAIIVLLVVLLKLSGFEQRLPDGTDRAKVLRADRLLQTALSGSQSPVSEGESSPTGLPNVVCRCQRH